MHLDSASANWRRRRTAQSCSTKSVRWTGGCKPSYCVHIQEREVDRIGGRAPIRLNVRIIATTNKDLELEVSRQTFREDLYFR